MAVRRERRASPGRDAADDCAERVLNMLARFDDRRTITAPLPVGLAKLSMAAPLPVSLAKLSMCRPS